MRCNFAAAIVKGLVEHGDAYVYFGSFAGFKHHWSSAFSQGWTNSPLSGKPVLTPEGVAAYKSMELDKLPREGRAYTWDWSKANAPRLD